MSAQRPLELILARNLISGLSTPAFLVDAEGVVVFYNEAAGVLLGRRFEEAGRIPPEQWTQDWGPFGEDGEPVPFDQLPLTIALRKGRPAHHRHTIQTVDHGRREIEVSAIPIITTEGTSGALGIFWTIGDGEI